MPVYSSAYFPSLAYVNALFHNSSVVIDLQEHFVKQSIRTRTEILGANGIIQLNVPFVHSANLKQTVLDVKIDYSTNWQTAHWRSIASAYASAPYFEHYAFDIQALFKQQYQYLHELNSAVLIWIDHALGLQLDIALSTAFTAQTPTDKKAWLTRDKCATRAYQQVFGDKKNFVENLSVLDGLMNEGPLLRTYFLPR